MGEKEAKAAKEKAAAEAKAKAAADKVAAEKAAAEKASADQIKAQTGFSPEELQKIKEIDPKYDEKRTAGDFRAILKQTTPDRKLRNGQKF